MEAAARLAGGKQDLLLARTGRRCLGRLEHLEPGLGIHGWEWGVSNGATESENLCMRRHSKREIVFSAEATSE